MLKELIQVIKSYKYQGFIIPSCDEFLGEYTPEDRKRLSYVTGFKGSNGLAIITCSKSAFFTDGRYILQSRHELSDKYEIFDYKDYKPHQWLEDNNLNNIGFDPFLHTEAEIKKFGNRVRESINFVDEIWSNKPISIKSELHFVDDEFSGESSYIKIKKITDNLEADYLLLTNPDSICWLLNVRANDVLYCPILLSFAFVNKNGIVSIFTKNELNHDYNSDIVNFYPMSELSNFVGNLESELVQLDSSSCPLWFLNNIKNFTTKNNPVEILKACKNKQEIQASMNAHIEDAKAIIKFLYWLEHTDNVDEVDAADKILEFRKESQNFVYPSFNTISAYGSNGAIIHYAPSKDKCKKIQNDNLYLIDSGGQYYYGTTDVTRVIHLGEPTKEQIENYTLVLKGHIALASVIFPIGTSGANLDVLARQFLWEKQLDYPHGTGHGVGSFLNVHEGPQSIGKYNLISLKPGMILSNEPGYYVDNNYGIRIENLMYVDNYNSEFLCFRQLTLVPYEKKLIDKNLLTQKDIDFINHYHHNIFLKISAILDDKNIINWLELKCSKI